MSCAGAAVGVAALAALQFCHANRERGGLRGNGGRSAFFVFRKCMRTVELANLVSTIERSTAIRGLYWLVDEDIDLVCRRKRSSTWMILS